jgi:hypothetical protein
MINKYKTTPNYGANKIASDQTSLSEWIRLFHRIRSVTLIACSGTHLMHAVMHLLCMRKNKSYVCIITNLMHAVETTNIKYVFF